MTHSMTWADFYLICFAVGFCFSFFSFLLGGSRTGRLHLPHFHGHVGGAHLPSMHGPVAAGHAPVAGDAPSSSSSAHAHHSDGVSPFNFVTLTAFLAWFGGTGYLLTRYSGLWVGFGLLASAASGLVGGSIVFLFLSKCSSLTKRTWIRLTTKWLECWAEFCSSIREGGTGEIIYTQMGTRRVCGARSDDGSAIVKGAEVVATRYEKGIAYVRLWSEISGDH